VSHEFEVFEVSHEFEVFEVSHEFEVFEVSHEFEVFEVSRTVCHQAICQVLVLPLSLSLSLSLSSEIPHTHIKTPTHPPTRVFHKCEMARCLDGYILQVVRRRMGANATTRHWGHLCVRRGCIGAIFPNFQKAHRQVGGTHHTKLFETHHSTKIQGRTRKDKTCAATQEMQQHKKCAARQDMCSKTRHAARQEMVQQHKTCAARQEVQQHN